MIKPDAAAKQLEKWTLEIDDEFPLAHLNQSIKKLPKKLRDICYGLAECNSKGEQDYEDATEEFAEKQANAFGKLTKAERSKVLKALFPSIAGDVEVGLAWLSKQENSHHFSRHPFRRKLSKAELANNQVHFVRQLMDLCKYDADVVSTSWLAAWAGHIAAQHYHLPPSFSVLLAAVIDRNTKSGKEVFEILCASARKDHEIGIMGHHVCNALLFSSRPDGWELMEKMLLAAQRQEGLRQSILSAVEDAHPQAFIRMLKLIVENNLTRFSSVVYSFNSWFGMNWNNKADKKLQLTLSNLLEQLESSATAMKSLKDPDPETVYFALWALAYQDENQSIKPCQTLMKSSTPELRFVATAHLSNLHSPKAIEMRTAALDDEDFRVVNAAFEGSGAYGNSIVGDELSNSATNILFQALERTHDRLPVKTMKLKSCVWPWTESEISRKEVVSYMSYAVQDRDPLKLIPYMKSMDTWSRAGVIRQMAEKKKWDSATRDAIFLHAGDTSADVREAAFQAIENVRTTGAEVKMLEGLLTRTASDLRNGVVEVLLRQNDPKAFDSADRLLNSKVKNQRLAGLELLRQLSESERDVQRCVEFATHYQDSAKRKIGNVERQQLEAILDTDREVVRFEDCLGLADPTKRTSVIPPTNRKVNATTPSMFKLLKSLDSFIHKNRDTTFINHRYGRDTEMVLGEVTYGFPYPSWNKPIKEQMEDFPLHDDFVGWYKSIPASCKDKDGFQLLRAMAYLRITDRWSFSEFETWAKGSTQNKKVLAYVAGSGRRPKFRYTRILGDVITWLFRINPPKKSIKFATDVAETIYSQIPAKEIEALSDPSNFQGDDDEEYASWRDLSVLNEWSGIASMLAGTPGFVAEKSHGVRRWQLEHWIDEPVPGSTRSRPELSVFAAGYGAKKANITDFYDHLIGPVEATRWGSPFGHLASVSGRVAPKDLRDFCNRTEIKKAVETIAERLLEIELGRGESPTVTTDAALAVKAYRGTESLHRLLTELGKSNFKKISSYRASTADSREATFTSMIGNTYPLEGESKESFAKLMKASIKDDVFPEERLIQLAFLAPQWTEFIQYTVKWQGFTEAIYWFMAHMKFVWGVDEAFASDDELEHEDDEWDEEEDEERPEKLSRWEMIIRERTPLTDAERTAGAIDVGWFQRTYKELTPKRWELLAAAAKYAATAAQAKRANLVADVLLGKASKKELVDGIKKRNLKENVRLLGLLPLAGGKKAESDVSERYEILQAYLKYANGLSSMSKPDALHALEIGMKNLAATAGYADPMRLQWAMEAASTRDLAKGPVVAKRGDVEVSLSLDEHAQPVLEIDRAGKRLKSLPKTVNKDKKFVELRDRAKHLKRQASRVKQSLESAMCRGDVFTGAELMQLSEHAILWPQLQRIVLVGEGIFGYPDRGGKALRDQSGKLEPVKKNEKLRIAHSFDLLKTKKWAQWQRECFAVERIQPFKQVFRELYVVTSQERKDKLFSNRYAGQQVNQRQAYALWGRRGWSVDEYENVWKAFHEEGINVTVSFNDGYTTPLEVEGLTLDKIEFSKRGEYKPMKIADVPPRLFSEAMRDLDLVVSVAHVGDVDPEASASTVEMRSMLLKETCQLLNIKNVKLKADRAMINGTLGKYSIHLGSGVVHRMPGGAVCLVPVHSQHRGRLFLPFADDDPRTAEVISKTLLLSRDEDIDDPILLEQIT